MSETHIWHEATIVAIGEKDGLEVLSDGAIVINAGKIVWVGKEKELSQKAYPKAKWFSAKGALITPGLIDCHTHLVFAGNRSGEWIDRLAGKHYEAILRDGGGIYSTVEATRQISEEDLLAQSLKRAQAMLAGGVTTVEIKSGYGLDLETERKILRVAREIGKQLPLEVKTTFLGAHALPRECKNQSEYIQQIIDEMLPALMAENLVDAVDAFCDPLTFNQAALEDLYQAATRYVIPVKIHSDQTSSSRGAALIARYQGLSADHLEYIREEDVKAMARSKVVAVLLPGAQYFLNQAQCPPIHLFRQYGVSMAVATDCNPGTSPTTSLLLMMNMACVNMGLTPEEALRGVTIEAARALGVADTRGSLAPGKLADFVLWDVDDPIELSYYFGRNPCLKVMKEGKVVYEKHSI